MQVIQNHSQKNEVAERLSNFSMEWSQTAEQVKELCDSICMHYFTEQWPVDKQFKIKPDLKMHIYSNVYNLCTQKLARTERLYAFFQDILRSSLLSQRGGIFSQYDSIEFYLRVWWGYRRMHEILSQLFCYLDRYYLNDVNLPSLKTRGITIFLDLMFQPERKQRLFKAYFDRLAIFRDNYDKVDTRLLTISQSFKELSDIADASLHNELFQAYLKECSNFYEWLRSRTGHLNFSQYIEHLTKLQKKQHQLFNKTIWTNTERLNKLSVVFSEYLVKPFESLLITNFKHLLQIHDTIHIQQVVSLFKTYHNTQAISKQIFNFYRNKGFKLFERLGHSCQPKQYIKQFSKLYDEDMKFITNTLNGHNDLIVSCRNAMQSVINVEDDEFHIAQNLAIYINNLLVDRINRPYEVDEALIIFECLNSKDIFMKVYEKQLSTRLLSNRYRQLSDEMRFVLQVKQKCGNLFTEGAEGRIKDFENALEIQKKFKGDRKIVGCTFRVLSKKSWLSDLKIETDHQAFDFEWPPEVDGLKMQFCAFYMSLNQNQHIQYLPLLSSAVLVVPLNHQNKLQSCQVTVNLVQACLLIFLDRVNRPVTFVDLHNLFQCEESLIVSCTEPMLGRLIELKNNIYSINRNFVAQDPLLNFKDHQELRPRRKESINTEKDRDIIIQGAIIKILKRQKAADIYNLFDRISKSITTFRPSFHLMKESINNLIEKEYALRDDKDSNLLHYKQ